jgi:hypothetical protein
MTFIRDFNTEYRRLAPVFAAAANADREFHAGWKDGLARLGAGRYKETDQYEYTLDHFHESSRVIDQIVEAAFSEVQTGRYSHLATLFAYIALPGRYFRSGYQRARIWRFLKGLCLDDEQADVLRGIVVQQITASGPEFVEIARTARKVNSDALRGAVKNLLLQPQKDYVLARGIRLLKLLEVTSIKK